MAAPFRSPKLDISCFVNSKVLRDHAKRKAFKEYESERQALRYMIRNTQLPQRTRASAQLKLSQMHPYTKSTGIRNRCILAGRSRGVFREFRMCRYQFRMAALAGELPGVRKAVW